MKRMSQVEPDALKEVHINDYDSIAAIYDQIMGSDIARILFSKYERIIRGRLIQNRPLRYLDIACGTGSFLRLVKKQFGKNIECSGIDLSKGQIATARKIAAGEKLDIAFKTGDVLTTIFPAQTDLVTMNLDAMNHLKHPRDWKTLLGKVSKSLGKGGVFLFDINTQERLRNDLNDPEVIIKKNLTYVQVGVKLSKIGTFVLQQHLMQIFKKEKGRIIEYNAHIQQIAPTKNELFKSLKEAGFVKIKEINFSTSERTKHIFLKNRLFVSAQRV